MIDLPQDTVIRIGKFRYKMSDKVPRKGNIVLDLRDGSWAYCLMKHRNHDNIAIGSNPHFAEVGVPLASVKRLERIKSIR